MTNANFRDLFPFDEPGSINPVPGGLPGLLQQVMPPWRPQPGLLDVDPASLFQQPGKALDAQQLRALADRGQLTKQLSSDPTDVDAASPRDPNFRQLVSRPERNDQQPASDHSLDIPDRPQQMAVAPDVRKLWSLFDSLPALPALPGGYCAPIPGQEVRPGTPIWPLPEESKPADWGIGSLIERFPGLFARPFRKEREEEEVDCEQRASDEKVRCYKRKWQIAHPDYLHGCIERAKARLDLCRRNGGKPRPDEPPEWTDPDEETSRNPHR